MPGVSIPAWKLDMQGYKRRQVNSREQTIPHNMSHLKSEMIMKNLLKKIYNIDYCNVRSISVTEKELGPGDVTGNLSESGRLVINLVMNSGQVMKFNWFVKIMPKQHKNSELMHKFRIFENEISFYRDIAPDLIKFLNDNGVKDVEFDIPKLLFADNKDEEGAVIILDDVSEQGYSQERDSHGRRFLSLKKARPAIDAIARIHAASKLYNVHKATKLEEKHATLCHNKMWEDTDFIDRLAAMKESYCEVLKKSSEHDSPRLLTRFQKRLKRERLKSLCAERYHPKQTRAVYLQHGDFHYNNLLFKEEEGKSMRVMVVDWQLAYSGRSTGDVSYLLLSSISPEMRQDHGKQLKEEYFTSFNSYVKRYEFSIINHISKLSCGVTNSDCDEDSDVEVAVCDLENDFHTSAPLSLFLSCGNVLSSEADRFSTPDISEDEWEQATVSFAYNLVKEAADMKII